MSKTPTLCRIETLITKDDRDRLAAVASRVGVPLSILLRKVIQLGVIELLRLPEEREQSAPPITKEPPPFPKIT